MAIVDRTTSIAEIGLLYWDNCGYEEDDDVAMAARFVTVCRAMLHRAITRIQSPEGGDTEFSPVEMRAVMGEAQAFIAGKSASRVRYSDLRVFRT